MISWKKGTKMLISECTAEAAGSDRRITKKAAEVYVKIIK